MQALSKYAISRGQSVNFSQRTASAIVSPQQGNYDDCGVFTGAFAAAAMHGIEINAVQQSLVPTYRTKWSAALSSAAESNIYTIFTPAMLGP